VIGGQAREVLNYLECVTGHAFDRMPVDVADQWTASLRDSFTMEGVTIDDPVQAQAAFAGALAVVEVFLLGGGVLSAQGARHVAMAMRGLAEKASCAGRIPPLPGEMW
jgi:hypothetical protein